MIKIIFIAIILYPWNYAITKRQFADRATSYIFPIQGVNSGAVANSKNENEAVFGSNK